MNKRLTKLILTGGLVAGLVAPARAQNAPSVSGGGSVVITDTTPADAARPALDPMRARAVLASKLMSGRALWVKRDQLVTPERIIRCVDEAADLGYTILFVQIRGRGDAWYESRLVPKAELISRLQKTSDAPYDPLAYLLKRAHARGLQVHAWVNMFLAWSGDNEPMLPGHVLTMHPDWVAVDAAGRRLSDYSMDDIKRANIEGVFLAAGNPAVREHLKQVVHEIAANYPVDGIHLDYIRCPLVDTGYDPASRAAFMAEVGVDPWMLRHSVAGLEDRFGKDGVASLEKDWKAWRAAQVTRLVAAIRADLDSLDRPVILSAAVFPNCKTAPIDVGQEWTTWCKRGYMDMVVPMFYSPSTETVMRQLEQAQAELPLSVILYAGLAVYNQPLMSAAQKAIQCRKAGANGVSFFPYDTLAEHPGALAALTRLAFGAPAGSNSAGAR